MHRPLTLAFVSVLAFVLPGCGPLAAERGALAVVPAVVYLPGASEGQATVAPVAIYNVGEAPLEVVALQLGITTGYGIEAPALPARLAPGEELELRIRRWVGQGVPEENALEVVCDDPVQPSLRVELRALAAEPLLAVSPATIEFGAVASGASAARPIAVRNLGLGVARALSIEWLPGSSPDFTASLPEAELAPGAASVLELRYAPRGGGTDHAELRVRYTGARAESTRVTLSGHQDLVAPD